MILYPEFRLGNGEMLPDRLVDFTCVRLQPIRSRIGINWAKLRRIAHNGLLKPYQTPGSIERGC